MAHPGDPQSHHSDAPDGTADVILRRQGRIGRITLNRPRALNALTVPMIQAIQDALERWQDDPAVHAIVIEGAGGRAFCAGGDIRAIRDMAADGDHAEVEAFFVAEYGLNLAIARCLKPWVSLIDGVCMGGGIGLSIHGSARVATEAAVFAMPEAGIGLFPDVGATHALARLRPGVGMYMGLTGARLGGADALWAGIATHYTSRETLAELADEMAEEGVAVLGSATVPTTDALLPYAAGHIRAFEAEGVDAIVAALEADGSDWAEEALQGLLAMSPTSVLWSYEMLRRGAGRTLEACLQAELALMLRATRGPDFLEGVRAMVVDKDRQPRWSPASLAAVDRAAVDAMVP